MNCLPRAIGVAAQVRSADRWISRTTAATVAGLAGIAGALSCSHMRALAQDHGQADWHAHAFPLSVDGVEIVASLVLLADRRSRRRSGWLPWSALAVGTAGSLAANIAAANPDPVSRVIAEWPALALLLAVKLLSGPLKRRDAPRPLITRRRPVTRSLRPPVRQFGAQTSSQSTRAR
jgi:peptidoglycan/LPS O-acetylase OafA/YrhL